MNRLQALTIEIADWMDAESFQTWIQKFGIEWTIGTLTEDPTKRVIWLHSYDPTMFDAIPEGETLNILKNFRMFYDNGSEEIAINENNYMNFWNQRKSWYMTRKGTYDPPENEITN